MSKTVFKIDHSTNNFKIYDAEDTLQYTASWFLEFGKTTAEIYNTQKETLFFIVKKFRFWQWKMTYKILNVKKEALVLSAENKKNNIFKLTLNDDIYQIKVHYYDKKSVFKNEIKIAEIDDAFAKSKEENTSNLLLANKKDLEIVLLLFICLKTGEDNQKPLIKPQKELIPNEDQWN